MTCFMVSMSMESLVDSALATGEMVRAGVHGVSRVDENYAVLWSMKYMASWI